MKIRFLFEPRDLWVGVFWRLTPRLGQVFVCLFPGLPLLFEWKREQRKGDLDRRDDQRRMGPRRIETRTFPTGHPQGRRFGEYISGGSLPRCADRRMGLGIGRRRGDITRVLGGMS